MNKKSSKTININEVEGDRLDVFLVLHRFVQSREKAKKIISEGLVLVNGDVIKKHNRIIRASDKVSVTPFDLYVGRGGEKLQYALEQFNVNTKDLVCLDVGSSTGGFTEVLLRNGALKVYAIDVGTNQFDRVLATDPRIVLMESTDIREVQSFPETIDLAVIDVSFVSLVHILPKVFSLIKKGGTVLALVKPQFEVGHASINKGVVKNIGDQLSTVLDIVSFSETHNARIIDIIESHPKGKKGNREFFIYMTH